MVEIKPEHVEEAERYVAWIRKVPREDVAGRIDDDGRGITVAVRLPAVADHVRLTFTVTES